MYYDIKSISIKGGVVYLTAADSNTYPKTYFRSPLMGGEKQTTRKQLERVGKGLFLGDFQLLDSNRCKLSEIYRDQVKQSGGDWRSLGDVTHGEVYEKAEKFGNKFARACGYC